MVESKLFTSNPQVRDRLNKALRSDPDHITPGSSGDHVAAIQKALSLLGKVRIADSEIERKFYGPTTAAAVAAFKRNCTPPLLNYANQIDEIVGKKTTFELDRQMKAFEKNNPSVDPVVPTGGSAEIQVGPLGPRGQIVTTYYRDCGLETVGPARVNTSGLATYRTFEGLLDLLLTRSALQQVVVNHGNPEKGLIVRWCAESSVDDTQSNIPLFSKIADAIQAGTANKNNNDFQDSLDSVKFMLSINERVALRIAGKLVRIRQKPLVFHLRACNLPSAVAQRYKEAFRALMITFHPVRLLFLRIRPVAFVSGHSAADFPFANNTVRDRARVFTDPFGELTTLVIAARDLDGHTLVDDFSFVDRLNRTDIQEWAEVIIGRWAGTAGEFVIPVMWDNTERSFSCPAEDSWRAKLAFV